MTLMKDVTSHYNAVQDYCDKHPGKPTVWATMLYGSQNYGLSSDSSDVDTKTMLLPSLQMVLMDKNRISTELTMTDGSLDTCKDLREMFGNYLKGNINFVETLFTPYYEVNFEYAGFFEQLRHKRTLIANAQPVRLMHMTAGMARQKHIAFNKPFEGKKEILDKYGYDPKQLHHLVRLYHFMSVFAETIDFYQALYCAHPMHNPELHDYLMDIKVGLLDFEDAARLNREYMEKIDGIVEYADEHMPIDNGYEEAKKFLDSLTMKVLTRHFRKSL